MKGTVFPVDCICLAPWTLDHSLRGIQIGILKRVLIVSIKWEHKIVSMLLYAILNNNRAVYRRLVVIAMRIRSI